MTPLTPTTAGTTTSEPEGWTTSTPSPALEGRIVKPAQPNQSLIDGLACLQALTAHAEPIGSRELGRMLGLESTRVNRLLKTLAFLGLASQNEQRKYLPGPGIHVLAAQSIRGSGLIRRALDPIETLLDLPMQVALGVLWQDQVCYLYHGRHGDGLGRAFGREPVYPAASSGLGQALLAQLPDDDVRMLYDDDAHRHPVATPRQPVHLDGDDGLLAELAVVRKRGFALTRTLGTGGTRTLAIALAGDAAAIGVAGRIDDDDLPELLNRLREVAAQIEGSANTALPAAWG